MTNFNILEASRNNLEAWLIDNLMAVERLSATIWDIYFVRNGYEFAGRIKVHAYRDGRRADYEIIGYPNRAK